MQSRMFVSWCNLGIVGEISAINFRVLGKVKLVMKKQKHEEIEQNLVVPSKQSERSMLTFKAISSRSSFVMLRFQRY